MKNLLFLLANIMFFVFGTVAQSSHVTTGENADAFIPLPAGSVHLTNFLDDDIRNSIDHWNKGGLPYDKFVDFFRHGRPQFALGEMWGKAVRSGCMFYRYTQDPELKRIMDGTVKDLISTQRENGSISCVEIDKQPEQSELWERKYVMLGLDEYYQWVNKDPVVLEALKKQADNIISIVGHEPKTEIIDVGWSATNVGFEECHIESSTLLEPFMRLYKHTGEKRYLNFAAYIYESGGTKHFNVFEKAFENVEPYQMAGHYPKAYEMTSLFEGLVEYYRITGDPAIKRILLNYYNNIRMKEITIVGNGGANQPYHPQVQGEAWGNTALEQTNPDITRMMETCTGVTWMKFCSQILRLTGESSAMDEIERYIYNGLLGAMKPEGDGFSYVNLFNGEKVTNRGWGWDFGGKPVTCCNLNGPMGLAYIPFVAVMNSKEGPVVNLYNALTSSVTTPAGKQMKLDVETNFPLSDKVDIKVSPDASEHMVIRLRIPYWSSNTVVKVNGKKVKKVTSGDYLKLEREWEKGDKIEVKFDMKCHLTDAPKGSNRKGDDFKAVIYGPIVLARDENTDAAYNQPVQVVTGENGFVKVKAVNPTLTTTRMEFLVPTTDGEIRMIDFASVNGWGGKKICTWLPIKK
ncbi:MAG: glycoside hydrolase family 127 protein [Tannerella sp.]|jgi:DUF1680 family protein|nr:glycoside hydrolase family 127 protein [Tannerella sp.]